MANGLREWPAESRSLDDLVFGDGLIYRGYIAAAPRRHGAMRYCFRPMTPEQVAATEQAIRRTAESDRAAAVKVMAKTIAQQVTWCSATGEGLTLEQVARLHDAVFHRLWFQIIGEIPMDEGDAADSTTAADQLAADLGN